jgi:hypothetical protein
MTAAHFTRIPARPAGRPVAPRKRNSSRLLALVPVLLTSLVVSGAAFTSYLLWPRWPTADATTDAPWLPITISDATFNIPRAAIRMPVQRRAGAHERIDLVFLWPSLTPPATGLPSVLYDPAEPLTEAKASDRIFVTIAAAADVMEPSERVRTIYPRYVVSEPISGPAGLAVLAFRDDTPYRGEDLIYDTATAESFVVRCSRDGVTPGTCLLNRRIEGADMTIRFPRDWLEDWTAVMKTMERLIRGLHPSGAS